MSRTSWPGKTFGNLDEFLDPKRCKCLCQSSRSRQEFSHEYLLAKLASIHPRTGLSKFANNSQKLEKQVNKHRLNDKGSFVGRHGADAYFRSPLVDFYDGGIFDFDCKKRGNSQAGFTTSSGVADQADLVFDMRG